MAASSGLGAVLGWECTKSADITGTAWVWFSGEFLALCFASLFSIDRMSLWVYKVSDVLGAVWRIGYVS
jgi:hypothetical protein